MVTGAQTNDFDLFAVEHSKQYLDDNMTPADVARITGAPAAAIEALAVQIAANPEKTLFATGMGPNQFFNSDLKDRAMLPA